MLSQPDIAAIRQMYQTAAWRRFRRHQITAHPLCQACLDDEIVEVATAVGHRSRHDGDPDMFFDPDELISLCRPHQEAARVAKGL